MKRCYAPGRINMVVMDFVKVNLWKNSYKRENLGRLTVLNHKIIVLKIF